MESAGSQCVLAHFSALSGASSGLHYFSLDKRKEKGKGGHCIGAHCFITVFSSPIPSHHHHHHLSPITITTGAIVNLHWK